MVHVIRSPKVVFPSLPSWRQPSLRILECAEATPIGPPAATGTISGGHIRTRVLPRRIRGICVTGRPFRLKRRVRLGACGRARTIRASGRYRWSVVGRAAVRNGRSEIGREVENEFTIHYEVVIRLSQVAGKHFCSSQLVVQVILRSISYHHRQRPDRQRSQCAR